MNKNVKRLLALTMAFIMIFAAGIPVLADDVNPNNTPAANEAEPAIKFEDDGLWVEFKANYEKSKAIKSDKQVLPNQLENAEYVEIKRDESGNFSFHMEKDALDKLIDEKDGVFWITVYDIEAAQPRFFKLTVSKDGDDYVALSAEYQANGKETVPAGALGTVVNLQPKVKEEIVFVPGPVEFCLRWSYNDPNVGQDKYVLSTDLEGRIFYVDRGADPTVNPQYVDLETGEVDPNAEYVDADTAGKICFKGKLIEGKDYYVEWNVNDSLFVEGANGGLTGIFHVAKELNGKHELIGLKLKKDKDGNFEEALLDTSRKWEIDAVSTDTNYLDLGFDIPLTPIALGQYLIKAIGSENQPVRGVRFEIFKLASTDAYHYAKDQDGNYIVEEPAIYLTDETNWNGYTGIKEDDIKVHKATGVVSIKANTGSKAGQLVELRTGELLGVRAVKDGFPANEFDDDCDQLRAIGKSCINKGKGDAGYKYNGNVYVLNLWKVKNVDRYNKATKDPSIDPKTIFELRNDKVVTTVPFMDLFVTFRVKIFNAGATPQVREPITGAKVALYESGNTMVGEELKAGRLLKEKKTDQYGIAEFRNVPISQLKQFFNIDGPYCTDSVLEENVSYDLTRIANGYSNHNVPAGNCYDSNYVYDQGMYRRVYMPYLIKQLDTGNHEGVAPYPYFISTAGYFEYENGSTRTFQNLAITRADYGNVFDIEIENHVDFFGMAGRIAGENRYETSVEIAKKQFPDGMPEWSYEDENGRVYKNVVVAEVNTFADALTAGVVAYEYRAPLLMVKGDTLPESVANYIVESGATRAIIVGGNGTVSDKVANEIKDLGNPQPIAIQRLSGDNRFGTAVQVGDNLRKLIEANRANDSFTLGYDTKRTVFLANAYTFADALTASAPAAYYGIPILLTHQNKLAPETIEALKKWDIENVIIVGGEASVGKAVETELENLQIGGLTIERFSGANRQLTSMVLANKFFSDVTRVFFANKTSFADALAAAPYAAKVKAPIILVDKDAISNDVRDFLTKNNIGEGTIFGGYNQVSTQVRDELAKILNLRSEYPGIE